MNEVGRDDASHRVIMESLGAHLLGHLSPAEDTAVTAHLDGCARCRGEVAELAPVVAALDLLGARDVDSPASPPAALGGSVRAAVARERVLKDRRAARDSARRAMVVAVAAVVAVGTVLGAGYGLGLRSAADPGVAGGRSGTTSPVPLEEVLLTGQVDGVQVRRAELVPHTWGVEVRFAATGLQAGETYRASVRSRDGRVSPAGEFVGVAGTEIRCAMQAAVLRVEAAGFDVFDSDGLLVLSAELPA